MALQFAVDGSVGIEKLEELLALGHENQNLDYKKYWDLSKSIQKHRLDFVVSVAAFSNTREGGYIVVGVDGTGATTHDERDIDVHQFDEADLASMARGYLSGRIAITVKAHNYRDRPVAVIYVEPTPDRLPVIFTKDGELAPGKPQGPVKFRRGQVYVRRGTRCVAAEHSDWSEVLWRHDQAVRDEARGPMNDILRRLLAAAGNSDVGAVADIPLAVDFGQDLGVFTEAVEAVHPSQYDELRRLVKRHARNVQWDAKNPWDIDDVVAVVDRLLVIGASAIREEGAELLTAVIDGLTKIYLQPITASPDERQGAMLWRTVATGAEALGGLAVREEAWWAVRAIALPRQTTPVPENNGGTYEPFYTCWMRHAATMAARAEILASKPGMRPTGGFVRFARQAASRVPALSSDVRDAPEVTTDRFDPDREDRVLDSICQFDYLWCILTLLARPGGVPHQAMPSFAVFYAHRTRPIVGKVSSDPSIRKVLAPDSSDADWARAIGELESVANTVSNQSAWMNWRSTDIPTVSKFLTENG